VNWLLSVVTKNPMVLAYIAAAAFAAGIATGGIPAWKYQGAMKDAVQAKYTSFVAQTKAEGEAAQKIALAKEAQDKLNKENADETYKQLMARNADLAMQLLNSRASRGYLPAASAGSSHPERACFNRLQLGEAIRQLDAGVQSVIDQGDSARIGLDTAKVFVKGR
jgi:hypothetical protein